MATQEEITKLQERAQELVNNLDELCKQVGSYRTAKDELQKASSELLGLVESTRQLCDESHQIIKAVNEIGSAKILERLNGLGELAGSVKQSLEEGLQTIRTVNQDGNAKILERLNELDQLAGSTKRSLEEGLQTIRTVNQDGSAKILEKLNELDQLAGSTKQSLEEGHQSIRTANQDGKAEIVEWLGGLDLSIQRASRRQTIILACGFGLVIILQILLFILAKR